MARKGESSDESPIKSKSGTHDCSYKRALNKKKKNKKAALSDSEDEDLQSHNCKYKKQFLQEKDELSHDCKYRRSLSKTKKEVEAANQISDLESSDSQDDQAEIKAK